MFYTLLSTSHRQLSTSHRQLSTSHRQVSTSHRQVSMSHTQLSMSHTQLSMSHRQVPMSHTQSSMSHSQAATAHRQVSTSHRQVPMSHPAPQSGRSEAKIPTYRGSARAGKSKRRRGKARRAYFIPPSRRRDASSDVILNSSPSPSEPGFPPGPSKPWPTRSDNLSIYYHISPGLVKGAFVPRPSTWGYRRSARWLTASLLPGKRFSCCLWC